MSDNTPETITIQLTQGQVTVIDAVDRDLTAFKWAAYKNGINYYAGRNIDTERKKTTLYLHRVILERKLGHSINEDFVADHINGDTVDNTRSNLRLATRSQNCQNRRMAKRNKSGYSGVSWYKRDKKWRARITHEGKRKSLGLFDTAEEAYEAVRKYHTEFTRL